MHLKTMRNYLGSRQQLPIPVGMQTQQLEQVKTTTLNSMKPLHCYNQKSETNMTAKILHKGQGTQMVKNNALFARQNKMCNLFPCLAFSWDNDLIFSVFCLFFISCHNHKYSRIPQNCNFYNVSNMFPFSKIDTSIKT